MTEVVNKSAYQRIQETLPDVPGLVIAREHSIRSVGSTSYEAMFALAPISPTYDSGKLTKFASALEAALKGIKWSHYQQTAHYEDGEDRGWLYLPRYGAVEPVGKLVISSTVKIDICYEGVLPESKVELASREQEINLWTNIVIFPSMEEAGSVEDLSRAGNCSVIFDRALRQQLLASQQPAEAK